MLTQKGHFYFLKDEFYSEISDDKIMQNKESGSRPFYYGVYEKRTELIWLIPVSSKYEKYKAIYDAKISKNGKCDTLDFAKITATSIVNSFLIQNMIPVTLNYIKNEYIKDGAAVTILKKEEEERILSKAHKILKLYRNGYEHLLFSDVKTMERRLQAKQLQNETLSSAPTAALTDEENFKKIKAHFCDALKIDENNLSSSELTDRLNKIIDVIASYENEEEKICEDEAEL